MQLLMLRGDYNTDYLKKHEKNCLDTRHRSIWPICSFTERRNKSDQSVKNNLLIKYDHSGSPQTILTVELVIV